MNIDVNVAEILVGRRSGSRKAWLGARNGLHRDGSFTRPLPPKKMNLSLEMACFGKF